MTDRVADLQPLIDHLQRTTALEGLEAGRVVADVLAFFSESTEQFVRRRHGELQASGLRNQEIFERVAGELAGRRVVAPELSVRQVRRLVYG
jgi:hypothetical protein